MIFWGAAGLILIYSISAYGWGRLAANYIYRESTQSIIYEIAVGLAIWVFIGGLLNAAGLAYALALDIIFLLGVLFFCLAVFTRLLAKKAPQQIAFKRFGFGDDKVRTSKILTGSIPILLIVCATSFIIITLLPTSIFNHHDDYYKYLPRLFRMLQSGKLGGTPFDLIGLDSFGAYPFLQSFVAAHFPLEYINGFDAVFCFLLGGLLLNDIGRRAGLHWIFRSGAVGAYIVINPQFVNISALYSGSLMIFALLYSGILLCGCIENKDKKEMFWAAIPVGLFTATVVGLKITFIPFVALAVSLFFLLLVFFVKPRKSMLQIAAIATASAGISLAPWLWSGADKIISIFVKLTTRVAMDNVAQQQAGGKATVLGDLFTLDKLFYGDTSAHFSFVVLSVLAAALWAGYVLIKRKETANSANLILLTAVGIATPVAYLVNTYLARNFEVGIRYTCPIILAAFPAIALLFTGINHSPVSSMRKMRVKQIAALLALAIGIMLFLDGWFGRLNRLDEFRTLLAYDYAINKTNIMYARNSLSKMEQQVVVSMQKRTKENTTILVWFETPFFLNFSRNKIFTVGGTNRIMKNVNLANGDKLGSYLTSHGVEYVIWQYKGVAPQISRANAAFQRALRALWAESPVVYDDGRRVILDISGD